MRLGYILHTIRQALVPLMVCLFVVVVFLAASREYTLAAGLAVFATFILLALFLIAITGYPATVLATISSGLLAVHFSDQLKFSLLRYHFQAQDITAVLSPFWEGDFGLITQYPEVTLWALAGVVVFVTTLGAVFRAERSSGRKSRSAGRTVPVVVVLGLALLTSGWLFAHSGYAASIRNLHMNRLMGDQRPLRVSVALVGLSENARLAMLMREGEPAQRDPKPELCVDCPDLVIVHVESVFDPALTRDYAHMPPLGELAIKKGDAVQGAHAAMRASVWGGFSWVTEFEIACGLNHALFGWAGRYTHYNIAPHLEGCVGTELKPLGYTGEVFYTTRGSFIGVRKAFRNYGFSGFNDAAKLGLPRRWQNITDDMMLDHLLTEMDQPSTHPRLFWLATTWNHGPHGKRYAKDFLGGPYDPTLTDDAALADYVNRLNHTLKTLARLQQRMRSGKRKIAVLLYGDHHPPFDKSYKKGVSAEADLLTPVVMLRNFDGPEDALQSDETVAVEFVMSRFLRFADLPPLPGFQAIDAITAKCPLRQTDCPQQSQAELRQVFRAKNR